MGKRGREGEEFKSGVHAGIIEGILTIASHLIRTSKSKTFSVKIRTLLRYGYTSYVYGTSEFKRIKGLASRVSMPKQLTNPYFYDKVEKELAKTFTVKFEDRSKIRYAIFTVAKSRKNLLKRRAVARQAFQSQ